MGELQLQLQFKRILYKIKGLLATTNTSDSSPVSTSYQPRALCLFLPLPSIGAPSTYESPKPCCWHYTAVATSSNSVNQFTTPQLYLRISAASLTEPSTGTTVSMHMPLSSPCGNLDVSMSKFNNDLRITEAPILDVTMFPSLQTGLVTHSGQPFKHLQVSTRSTACCRRRSTKSKALLEIPAPPLPTAS